MILRRYGNKVQSVELNFDCHALTEIGFRRDRLFSMAVDEFFRGYRRDEGFEIDAEAEGPVQGAAEGELLDRMAEKLVALQAGLAEGRVILIESDPRRDYPKTRDRKRTVVMEGENRLHFHWRVEPPLRVAVYEKVP